MSLNNIERDGDFSTVTNEGSSMRMLEELFSSRDVEQKDDIKSGISSLFPNIEFGVDEDSKLGKSAKTIAEELSLNSKSSHERETGESKMDEGAKRLGKGIDNPPQADEETGESEEESTSEMAVGAAALTKSVEALTAMEEKLKQPDDKRGLHETDPLETKKAVQSILEKRGYDIRSIEEFLKKYGYDEESPKKKSSDGDKYDSIDGTLTPKIDTVPNAKSVSDNAFV